MTTSNQDNDSSRASERSGGDSVGQKAARKDGTGAGRAVLGFFMRVVGVYLLETMLKGRGGVGRRLIPPVLGLSLYAVFGAAFLTALGFLDSVSLGPWGHFAGPAGWLAVGAVCGGAVALTRASQGRAASFEVAMRILLGLPIVMAWLVVALFAVLVGLPAVLVLVFGALGSLSIAVGRKPSQVGFPLLAVSVLTLIVLAAQFYGRAQWLQFSGATLSAMLAYGAATWLMIWTQKPLEVAEGLIRKYSEVIRKKYGESLGARTSGKRPKGASVDDPDKLDQEIDQHEKAIRLLAMSIKRLTRHRLVFSAFLAAFVGVAALCVFAYAVSFWLLLEPDGAIVLADSADLRPDFVHALSLSLRSLVGGDYSGVLVKSTFATMLTMSELVLGVYLIVVVILSFTLATSSHTDRMEAAAMQVVGDVQKDIVGYRRRLRDVRASLVLETEVGGRKRPRS